MEHPGNRAQKRVMETPLVTHVQALRIDPRAPEKPWKTLRCSWRTMLRMEDRHAYTLTDAARILGTSEGALRQRIRRGTLETFKENGRVYVYLPHTDNVQEDVHTPESHALRSADDELRARVELLEQELERAHELLRSAEERDRETRRLLAAALERIPPQLEAPSETRESPETATEDRGVEPHPERVEERVSWWRRMFGG